MKIFAIVNVSRKGLWPENENVTLVRAESREEIIVAILRGQDAFIEQRLTPCHEYLKGLFQNFRAERGSEDQDEGKEKEDNPTEEQTAQRILQEVSVAPGAYERVSRKHGFCICYYFRPRMVGPAKD